MHLKWQAKPNALNFLPLRWSLITQALHEPDDGHAPFPNQPYCSHASLEKMRSPDAQCVSKVLWESQFRHAVLNPWIHICLFLQSDPIPLSWRGCLETVEGWLETEAEFLQSFFFWWCERSWEPICSSNVVRNFHIWSDLACAISYQISGNKCQNIVSLFNK